MHALLRTTVERTPPRLRRPVALLIRTADGAVRDRLPGLAAEIAFWVVLSLPALVLAAIAAAGVLGAAEGPDWQQQMIERVVEVARVALTENTVQQLVPVLESLLGDSRVGLVSFAALAAMWTASRAVKVVLATLAIVYGRAGQRSGWQDRLLGFGITLGVMVVGTVLAPLMIAGPAFGETLQEWVGVDLEPLPTLWSVLYWPTTVVVATLALALLYHLGVPGRTLFRRALPGAVVATGVWLAGSGALRLYGAWIVEGESVYGPLAGPIVVLLWLWLTGFAVLLGGELNAQIDHVWPPGGDRRPDEQLLDRRERAPATGLLPTTSASQETQPDGTDRSGPDDDQLDGQETTQPLSQPPGARS